MLLRQGKISKWFSGIGQEAISVGSTYALNENDMIFPMHRNLGVFTTRKVDKFWEKIVETPHPTALIVPIILN